MKMEDTANTAVAAMALYILSRQFTKTVSIRRYERKGKLG